MNVGKRILAPLLMLLVLALVVAQFPAMARERAEAYTWFNPVQDIRRLLLDHYVEDVDASEIQDGAIEGMIETLDDPYTAWIPNRDISDFRKSTGGAYVGIGAEVSKISGWMTIITPMPGSPAIRAGLEAGDQIRAINGETTEDEPLQESIDRLTGRPGTPVTVTVHRPDADPSGFEIEIVRDTIRVETIEGVHRVGDAWDFWLDPAERIAYVRLTQFTETRADALREVVGGLVESDLGGLVLDLRFNPGGQLTAAIEIADLFLEDGRIVSIKGRAEDDRAWVARGRGTLPDFPMLVLVNGQSASASEIVAGALQDNERAVVLGTRTYGKGLVQNVMDLESGAGRLKLTTAYYYVPSGRSIQRTPDSDLWGVDPDPGFYVPMTSAEYRRMREVQRELDIIREGNDEGRWSDPAWIEDRLQDRQLSAGLRALRSRLDDGTWTAPGGTMTSEDEILAELTLTERREDLLLAQLERTREEIVRLRSFIPEEDAEGVQEPAFADLVPGDAVLRGGVLEIRDAEGNVVSTLRIEDGDRLEAALFRAGVSPVETEADAPTADDR